MNWNKLVVQLTREAMDLHGEAMEYRKLNQPDKAAGAYAAAKVMGALARVVQELKPPD